jgi:hypothetical protein
MVLLLSGTGSAQEPPRPGQENFLSRAVFADGRLWLLSDAGELSTIAPGQKVRVDAHLPEPALDICASDGVLRALTCARGSCTTWTLRRWAEARWTTTGTIRSDGDSLAGISCAATGAMLILTNRRLIEVVDGKISSVALSEKLRIGSVTSIHVAGDRVFAGINAGEWGGGLRRVDRKTGKVSIIEKTNGKLCGGPLNTDCDPVNGITDEPWKPECVAVAIGLVHFSPHGRIVEICGDDIRRIYFRGLGDPSARKPESGDEPFETEAFFGLVRTGKELVAVGVDGVYRFGISKDPTRVPLPAFESIGNIGVSFAFPDVVLVLTGINQRRSISGNVPLLVPR